MAVSPAPRYTYATLLTRNTYLSGVLVLWHSLRTAGSRYPLVVMITTTLCKESRDILSKVGIRVREVDPLVPPFEHNLPTWDSRFADTWTKLRGFSLLEYDRVVLLDSDMVVRRNIDDLFLLDFAQDQIAAVHVCACNPLRLEHYPEDWVPKNCAHTTVLRPGSAPPEILDSSPRPQTQLNSGTIVLHPSRDLSRRVLRALETDESAKDFTFPDQDLLALVFRGKWVPLPWYYNAMKTMQITHPSMWDDDVARCIHYILPDKPWLSRRSKYPAFQKLHDWWWAVFDDVETLLRKVDPEGAAWVASLVDTL